MGEVTLAGAAGVAGVTGVAGVAAVAEADGVAGPVAPAAPAALLALADEPAAPPATEAGLLLFELGGAGFIDRDFTTNTPWRPAKTTQTYLSYIRHKIQLTAAP